MSIYFNSCGSQMFDRIIRAYGFKSKVEYSNYLGISSAGLFIRFKRGLFPSDLVVKFMDKKNAKLAWLAIGEDEFTLQTE